MEGEPAFETSLSDWQSKLLALIPSVTGILSILGSSAILWLVSKERHKLPYHRILLAMSLCDILITLATMAQPFLVPANTSPRPWALGTDATCTMIGALQRSQLCL